MAKWLNQEQQHLIDIIDRLIEANPNLQQIHLFQDQYRIFTTIREKIEACPDVNRHIEMVEMTYRNRPVVKIKY